MAPGTRSPEPMLPRPNIAHMARILSIYATLAAARASSSLLADEGPRPVTGRIRVLSVTLQQDATGP